MTEPVSLFDHDAATDALEIALDDTVRIASDLPVDAAIATCPGWDASDLWRHLGTVHRWATEIVAQRSRERIRTRSIDLGLPADADWAAWLEAGGSELVRALRSADGAEPLWAWSGDRDATWWSRRQLHETVVHNADGTLAGGGDFSTDASVAIDGIAELLENTSARLRTGTAEKPAIDATVHLHATDDPGAGWIVREVPADAGEFMIELADGELIYEHSHGKGDVAVRGPASELMLVLNRRRSLDAADVEVFGDAEVLEILAAIASM
ncbi:MAG: maleylpyruvate isomerase family mycothiol-dependent enzyme [Microthrixaceae bacterium]